MKNIKCDICEKEQPKPKVDLLTKTEVEQRFKARMEVKTGFFGVKIKEWWKRKEFGNIEKNNPNYKRKTRVCGECRSWVHEKRNLQQNNRQGHYSSPT